MKYKQANKPPNTFCGIDEVVPVFSTLAKGLAPLNCKRSVDPLGCSLLVAVVSEEVGSGIPNRSSILGVVF